tara:strand:+ start:171 stop:452 length:282 start_codon:yes stop_codon:yes gene_type:complete
MDYGQEKREMDRIYGKKTTPLTRDERMLKLQGISRAQELIYKAQELIDDAVKGTEQETHYQAYGRYGIDQLLCNGNPNDNGIQDLIRELQNEL